MEDIRTAVLPVAGWGTRMLPASKAVPKELLPVVDRPSIEYVVAEAVAAGLRDVLLVTAAGKEAVVDHFDRLPALEEALARSGKTALLEEVRRSAELAQVHTVRQGEPLGLGHAVLQAECHVAGRPFAVLLPDDLIAGPLLRRMLDLHRGTGSAVVALVEVPAEEISRYGAAATSPGPEPDTVRIDDLVEKPAPEEAPSRLAVIGRYVLPPDIFAVLAATPPGRGGEIQLTDALRVLAAQGRLLGVVHRGVRHDTGDRLGYLRAVVDLAVHHPEVGAEFEAWLRAYLDGAVPRWGDGEGGR